MRLSWAGVLLMALSSPSFAVDSNSPVGTYFIPFAKDADNTQHGTLIQINTNHTMLAFVFVGGCINIAVKKWTKKANVFVSSPAHWTVQCTDNSDDGGNMAINATFRRHAGGIQFFDHANGQRVYWRNATAEEIRRMTVGMPK
jgi:hypothetical protein